MRDRRIQGSEQAMEDQGGRSNGDRVRAMDGKLHFRSWEPSIARVGAKAGGGRIQEEGT